jgi:hypothetical protein
MMDNTELQKQVGKAKFEASQLTSELHDLIEDRMPKDFELIPEYAHKTYLAWTKWHQLNQKLLQHK